jgi:hypothetical protein
MPVRVNSHTYIIVKRNKPETIPVSN